MSDDPGLVAVRRGLVLAGLPGDNPLGFLAAVGSLRVLAGRWPERRVRMTWVSSRRGWRPVVNRFDSVEESPRPGRAPDRSRTVGSPPPVPALVRAEVVQALHDALAGRHLAPEFALREDGAGGPREIRLRRDEFAGLAAASVGHLVETGDRTWCDFCAAYGTDADADDPEIAVTDLHFSSDRQTFMGRIRALVGEPPPPPIETTGRRRPKAAGRDTGATAAAHLDHALFEPWSYSDPRPSLRWDPLDDRRYAYRAFDPTNGASRRS